MIIIWNIFTLSYDIYFIKWGYYQRLNNSERIDNDENDDKVIDDNNENIHMMTKRSL